MEGNSNSVTTNQDGIHPDLEEIVLKQCQNPWQGPLHQATKSAFQTILPHLKEYQNNWVLDSGCGVGDSTQRLAVEYPNSLILGVDRSEVRLNKADIKQKFNGRVHYLRAELGDFWRLLVQNQIHPIAHYILYPNPYPKKHHIRKRFHGSSSIRELIQLSPKLELRSNWKLYLKEFQFAFKVALNETAKNKTTIVKLTQSKKLILDNNEPWTAFEKKFFHSQQELWKLECQILNKQ